MIELIRAGMFATIQDLGRVGYAHLGVPRSGAADRRSFRLANRLVGNPDNAACIEFTLGGAAVRFHRPVAFALTGAPTPVKLRGKPAATDEWLYGSSGDVVELGIPQYGLRTYMSVAGGFEVPETLSSKSTDTLSGLGPDVLAAGQKLAVGSLTQPPLGTADTVLSPVPGNSNVSIRYRRGPRDDSFAAPQLAQFESAAWEVSAQSNRVGARLTGPKLETCAAEQLPSEGMVTGSIEVPPSGQPIVFLADHPPTGGYPVIGVVESMDVSVLSQARPGTKIRFDRIR